MFLTGSTTEVQGTRQSIASLLDDAWSVLVMVLGLKNRSTWHEIPSSWGGGLRWEKKSTPPKKSGGFSPLMIAVCSLCSFFKKLQCPALLIPPPTHTMLPATSRTSLHEDNRVFGLQKYVLEPYQKYLNSSNRGRYLLLFFFWRFFQRLDGIWGVPMLVR